MKIGVIESHGTQYVVHVERSEVIKPAEIVGRRIVACGIDVNGTLILDLSERDDPAAFAEGS